MKSKYIRVVAFFLILTILPIVTIILPKKDKSYNENKTLQSIPDFNFETYSNKSFMSDFEKYFSDHFFLRENWVTIKSHCELAQGKRELKGVYVGNNQLIEKLNPPNKSIYNENIKNLKEFTSNYPLKTYLMVVPTAEEIQKSNLPAFAPSYNQQTFINEIYKELSGKMKTLDAYTPLVSASKEYIYYRTDHHWTAKGAYQTYFSTGKSLGIEPLAIDKFDIEHASNDFKGTLYSKCLYDGITPDIIDLYSLSKGDNQFVLTDIDGKVINDSSVYFKENLTEKDKYLTYTGDNRGLTKIINKNLQDGIAKNKLLIFKDSYANAIIPFLVNHFDEISVVDLRYLNKSLEETINFDDYGKILFLYNTDSFATQKLFSKLFS